MIFIIKGFWTIEEGRRTYQPKRCGNSNKDEDDSLKILNDKIAVLVWENIVPLQQYFHWVFELFFFNFEGIYTKRQNQSC